jgi:hypothetical protein
MDLPYEICMDADKLKAELAIRPYKLMHVHYRVSQCRQGKVKAWRTYISDLNLDDLWRPIRDGGSITQLLTKDANSLDVFEHAIVNGQLVFECNRNHDHDHELDCNRVRCSEQLVSIYGRARQDPDFMTLLQKQTHASRYIRPLNFYFALMTIKLVVHLGAADMVKLVLDYL